MSTSYRDTVHEALKHTLPQSPRGTAAAASAVAANRRASSSAVAAVAADSVDELLDVPLLHHEIARLSGAVAERDQLLAQFRSELDQHQITERRLHREVETLRHQLSVATAQAISAIGQQQQQQQQHTSSHDGDGRTPSGRRKSLSPPPVRGAGGGEPHGDESATAQRLRRERAAALAAFDSSDLEEHLRAVQAELQAALADSKRDSAELLQLRSDKAALEAEMTLLRDQAETERRHAADAATEHARFKEQKLKDMAELVRALNEERKKTAARSAAPASATAAAPTAAAPAAVLASLHSDFDAVDAMVAAARIESVAVEVQTDISGARAEEFFGDFGSPAGGGGGLFGGRGGALAFGGGVAPAPAPAASAAAASNTHTPKSSVPLMAELSGATTTSATASRSVSVTTPGSVAAINNNNGASGSSNTATPVRAQQQPQRQSAAPDPRLPSPERIGEVQGKLGDLELRVEEVENALRTTLDQHLQNRNRMSLQRHQRQMEREALQRRVEEERAQRQRALQEARRAAAEAGDAQAAAEMEFEIPPSSHLQQQQLLHSHAHSYSSGSNNGNNEDGGEAVMDAQDREIEAKLRRLREQLQLSNPNYRPLSAESADFLSSARAFGSSASVSSPYERFLEGQKRKAVRTAEDAKQRSIDMTVQDWAVFVAARHQLAQEVTIRREAEERLQLCFSAHSWLLRVDFAHRAELQAEVDALDGHNKRLLGTNEDLEREKLGVARQLAEERQRSLSLSRELDAARMEVVDLNAALDAERGRTAHVRMLEAHLALARLEIEALEQRVEHVMLREAEDRALACRLAIEDRALTVKEQMTLEMLQQQQSKGRQPVVVPPAKRQLDTLQKELDETKDALDAAHFESAVLKREALRTNKLVTMELLQCLLERFTNLTAAREQLAAMALERKQAVFAASAAASSSSSGQPYRLTPQHARRRSPSFVPPSPPHPQQQQEQQQPQSIPRLDISRASTVSSSSAHAGADSPSPANNRPFLLSTPREKRDAVAASAARREADETARRYHGGDLGDDGHGERFFMQRSPRSALNEDETALLSLNARYTVLVDGTMVRLYEKFTDYQWRLALATIEKMGSAKLETALAELQGAVAQLEQKVHQRASSQSSAAAEQRST